MSGSEWMESLLTCEQARSSIPLELQATLPLPGRHGAHTLECWYYRIECQPDGPVVYSPERYAIWDSNELRILSMTSMVPIYLGPCKDILTKEHREREDAYLNGLFIDCINGSPAEFDDIMDEWLSSAPLALRKWLNDAIMKE